MTIFNQAVAKVPNACKATSASSRIIWMLALFALATIITNCHGGMSQQRASSDVAPANLWMFEPLHPAAPVEGIAAEKVNLGRRLYFDTHLSVNNSISCNSCHDLANYGADKGHAVSTGYNGMPGGRNSPTVYNAVLQFAQYWDGRAPTLAAQAAGPMMNPVEMGMSGPEAVLAVLRGNPEYVSEFHKAYPDSKDPVTIEHVTDAIAGFEAGLLTPSRWDDFLRGNENALTADEKEGLHVFISTGCSACHAGTGMGGNSYQKLGAFRDWPDQKLDRGRFAITNEARDSMYFKVPLLRNVEETGPWFHNGQVTSLDEAVRLMAKYQTGRDLSQKDVHLILSFLHTLTGPLPHDYVQPPAGTSAVKTGVKQGE